MKSKFLLFVILLCNITLVNAQQHTILVPGDQPTIQAGIDAAQDGDIVLVDTGKYYENINFNGKAITVKSYYDPENQDSSYIFNTVIDGSQPINPDLASVVSFGNWSDTSFVLSGFTIKNGTGTRSGSWRSGGGIICNGGAKIIHNRIINNSVDQDHGATGGGVDVYGNGSLPCFVLSGNIIENNYLHNTEGYPGGAYGGGIYCGYVNVIIENNIINFDTVEGRPYGCGLFLYNCNGIINDNRIAHNFGHNQVSSYSRGAGIYIQDYRSGMKVTGNTIENNEFLGGITFGGGIGTLTSGGFENNEILIDKNIIRNNVVNKNGGGIYLESPMQATVSNNAIIGNESKSSMGGGIYMSNDFQETGSAGGKSNFVYCDTEQIASGLNMPVLVNNTIIANSSPNYGSSIASYMYDEEFLAFNNIIQDSTNSQGGTMYLSSDCNAYIYYNCIDEDKIGGSGTWQGDSNILVDPCLQGDLIHLEPSSCCIDEGITSIDVNGVRYICPGHDIDGDFRPKKGGIDLGADECLGPVGIAKMDKAVTDLSIFPNPCADVTRLRYLIRESGYLTCDIFTIDGRKIRELINEIQMPGEHEIELDISDLPAGIYLVRLQAGEKTTVCKLIVR